MAVSSLLKNAKIKKKNPFHLVKHKKKKNTTRIHHISDKLKTALLTYLDPQKLLTI